MSKFTLIENPVNWWNIMESVGGILSQNHGASIPDETENETQSFLVTMIKI